VGKIASATRLGISCTRDSSERSGGDPRPDGGAAHAAADLEVVQAAPAGEVASLPQAREIRVVFSEPMVVLGRIPDPVRAEFFTVSPPVAGSFRWSGTTTLVFTAREAPPYRHATR